MRRLWIVVLLLMSCNKPEWKQPKTPPKKVEPAPKKEEKPPEPSGPARLAVQIICIPVQGNPMKPASGRDRESARKLAEEILEEAGKGGDFDALVHRHTDPDLIPYPGRFRVANSNVKPEEGEIPRNPKFVFIDRAFSLEVGGVAMVEFDPERNPMGYFILKRTE